MAYLITIFAFIFSQFAFAEEPKAEATSLEKASIAQPYVTFVTNKGDFVLELNPARAPITVANFLEYANSGYYKGTIFHRVIKDFMIQGGGFTADMVKKATNAEIKNEANNGIFNNRGTVAMARTSKVDSASSQFFVNIKNNHFLNNGYRDFGYAVFGKVVSGMELLDTLSLTETGRKNGMSDVPVDPIIVNDVNVSYEKPASK
jgi:peptidyl-prolyl cis-trans isomerase A (cyclophilin A)